MSDDKNKNLNTMSLANQDEVPMSIESISDTSPKQQTPLQLQQHQIII